MVRVRGLADISEPALAQLLQPFPQAASAKTGQP